MKQRHHRIVPPQRNQYVADLEPSSPDRVDHRMVGACGRVRGGDRGIRAQMLRQLQRELHAGRKLRETLVDTELEVEGAVAVAENDRRGDRTVARSKRHDLALMSFGKRRSCAADETRIALVLVQGGAPAGLPAARFQTQECLERYGDLFGPASDVELHGPMLGHAMALAAKF